MSTTSEPVGISGFRKWWFRKGRFYASYTLLTVFSITTLLPFLWMIVASMKPLDAVEDLSPLPKLEQRARHVDTVQMSLIDEDFADWSVERKLDSHLSRVNLTEAVRLLREVSQDTSASLLPSPTPTADELASAASALPPRQQEDYVKRLAATQFSLADYYAHNTRSNYDDVWDSKDISFKKYYFNSIFVAGWVTLLQCFTSSLAAYAFARMRWRGRDAIFKLYLATMMIPGVVTMIPNYTLMVKLHLLDSYLGLIVPAAFTAFGTFLLRQFMLTIPPSLDEAATIDGATHWEIYWNVILPLARPGLIVLSIFTFMGNYGSFFWPLVLIKSEHLRTLPIGMLYFDSAYGNQTNLIMAASVMNIVPLIILFVVMQKHLVRGIQLGAVKG